ncbi:MAG: FtsX-like permease family protein [Deltaproteobacteria bacterium]|nr:FtsX-like permease family protein [Deltaproteobacteria bacterium]
MFIETVRLAIGSIVENRLRAFLTTLGIIFGVMSIIAVVSIVEGVFAVYTGQLKGLGAGFVFAMPGNPSATGKVRARPEITAADAKEVASRASDVLATSPYYFDRRSIQFRGKTVEQVVMMPVSERYPEIQNHFVARGRFFSKTDLRSRARVVVLGPDLAKDLGLRRPVGEQVRLYGVTFKIIGVMEEKNGLNAFGQPFDRAAIVPHSTSLTVGAKRGSGLMLIKLATVDDVERSKEEVRRVLRGAHHLRRGEPDDFQLVSQGELLDTVGKITSIATWVVLAIVSVALLVGGIGIMNIMLVSVTERTREIGIRMAVGARPSDIMAQFLVESTLLGVIGGLLGIALGYAVAYGTSWLVPDFPPPSVPTWAVLLAFFFSASIGIFFGLYPAAKAAKLNPIDALRYE